MAPNMKADGTNGTGHLLHKQEKEDKEEGPVTRKRLTTATAISADYSKKSILQETSAAPKKNLLPSQQKKNEAEKETQQSKKKTSNSEADDGATSSSSRSSSQKYPEITGFPKYAFLLSVALGVFAIYKLSDYYAKEINSFKFERWTTTLHHPIYPSVAVTLYLITIATLRHVMRNRQPFELKYAMIVHNWILSAGSLVCLLKIMQQIIGFALSENGLMRAMYDVNFEHESNVVYFWYNVFYYSKYYELLDTVFICLRKKPLIFLHWYHHIITLWLCWVCMDDAVSVQWICISANAMVHVFMYYYYMIQSAGYSVWWKRHLTKLQILQFVLDEAGNLSWGFVTYVLGIKACGTFVGFIWGVGVIGSFLVLFLRFYSDTYKKPNKKAVE